MRLLLLCLAIALATAGSAAGARADKVAISPGKVTGLARSGYSVAWISAPTKGHCGPTVHLWVTWSGATYNLGKTPDAVCANGQGGVTDVAVAGNRVAWLAYTSGDTRIRRNWQLLTATSSSRDGQVLATATSNADATETPIVLGVASSSLIPYSVGSTVNVLKPDGTKAYTWQAPGPVTNTTANQANVAVFVKGGKCYVLSPAGVVTATYTFKVGSVQEFALASVGLLVQLPQGKVEIHNGASVRTVVLPAAARMLDFQNGFLLYRVGNQIRALRVATGKDAFVRYGSYAAVEGNGMSYATGRQVGSIAWVTFTSAVNHS